VVESAAAWTAAHNARDWTALRELLTGDVVAVDHRSVGFGTITGADDLVRFSRQLAELSPTVRMLTVQFDAISPAAGVVVRRSFGRTPEGGEFESVYRAVGTSDGETMARLEFFPLEAREAALTRFEELTSTPSGPAPNTCFRAFERGEDNAIVRRDWADLAEAVSDDVMLADRRSGLRVETRGREAFLRNTREMAGIRSMLRDLIATRGDHLALMKNTMSGHDRFGGDFEVDLLSVGECDAGGRITAIVFFDPTDLDAAFDELDTRFRAGEGAPYANVLGAAADESGIADDMVLVDHRIMGFGTSIGRDEFLRLHASLTDIAPSATRRCIAVHRLTTGGLVASTRTSGDVDGGGFDWDLIVLRIVRGERIVRTEYFDPDALDTALARFDELTAPSGPRPNRCLAVVTEARDVLLAHHYEAFGALHAADCIMEDRRTGVRVTTRGRAALIENTRGMTSVTSMPIHLVATRGERLALVGTAFVGAIAGGDFEVDAVQVVEIDESGLITRGALFDETAMDDAFAVLDDWYVEGEGAAQGAMLRAYQRGSNAYNAWDWERLRMTVTDDFVAVDHRSIGLLGEMHGRDEFVESLQKLAGMVTSGSFRVTAIEAVAGHGLLARAETRGVDLDGGTFELPWLIIAIVRDDRVARLEYFADDARDDALARFAELTS
jgi:ketosteroid isomerase-like protein